VLDVEKYKETGTSITPELIKRAQGHALPRTRYHLNDQDGSDRYTNHTEEACPMNNTTAFFKTLNSELFEKHKPPELGSSNNTSVHELTQCMS